MNSVLVQVIRERMRERSTEDLRDIWQTNDRATWSVETFEAVRLLLAERGVTELPEQGDPAPIAKSHSPKDVPENVYWLGWLKPALWAGILIGSATLVGQAVGAWELEGGLIRSWQYSYLDAPLTTTLGVAQLLMLPAILVGGCVACLRLARGARVVLLVYAWTDLAVVALPVMLQVWNTLRDGDPVSYVFSSITALGHRLLLPALFIALLNRPEIRRIFSPAVGVRGFDAQVNQEAADAPPQKMED